MTQQAKKRRWYDQDPLLSEAMQTLQKSSDEEQIRLAIHLVKIINEHKLEQGSASGREGQKDDSVDQAEINRNTRWYDIDKTLKNSVEMLRCCQAGTRKVIARELAQMLEIYMDENETDTKR